MAAFRYLVPALAIAGHAAAASCSVSATTTLSSAADATGLATCQTFSGSIAVATGTTDNIALDGIQKITGDLIAIGDSSTGVSSLSGDSLSSIGGSFTVQGLIHLTSLNFPMLTSAKNVTFQNLAALQGLSFTEGLQMVDSLSITDTQLTTLTGINLQQASQVNIIQNGYLSNINMQLGNVSDSILISSNSGSLKVSFPNLIWVNMMTINDASSVSIPSLASVNGTLGFYSNTFESLAAPNLTSIGGTLAIDDNNSLTNASMPELKTLGGGFQIQNNSMLANITGFPSLARVTGAVDVTGVFTSITLPALTYVRGAFTVQSSGDISSDCNTFASLGSKGGAVQGKYTCDPNMGSAATKSPTNSTGGSSGDGTSTSSSGPSSSSFAHPILIPAATGLLGVVAAIFGVL